MALSINNNCHTHNLNRLGGLYRICDDIQTWLSSVFTRLRKENLECSKGLSVHALKVKAMSTQFTSGILHRFQFLNLGNLRRVI